MKIYWNPIKYSGKWLRPIYRIYSINNIKYIKLIFYLNYKYLKKN
jgi:hypothetical protein